MKKTKRKTGIARLYELTRTKNLKLKLSLILGVIASAIKVMQVYFLYQIIRELVQKELIMNRIDFAVLMNNALGMIACGISYGLLKYIASLIAHRCAFEIVYELKMKIVNHISVIPIGYFSELTIGKTDKIVMGDTEKIEGFIAHSQVDLVETMAIAPLIIIYLSIVDVPFTLMSLLPVISAIFILGYSMSRPENKKDQVVLNDRIEEMQNEVIEYIEGMNEIKCYDIGDQAMSKYRLAIEGLQKIILKIAHLFGSRIGVYYALLTATILAIFPMAMIRFNTTDQPEILLSKFILFVIAAPLMKDYIMNLLTISDSVISLSESMKRIDEILDIEILHEPMTSKTIDQYDIVFNDVDFSYDNNQNRVLKNISFKANAGEMTAIIGSSGSGKSTIAKLILKFLVPNQGSISIGGVNLSEIRLEELMKKVSFVFQESYLFHDSIYFNITMGKDIELEKVIEVCKIVNLHEKIEQLSNGYQTVVGKNEGFFSSGEIQRLAVARVMLKDTKIIVLDEATAYADAENELNLQRAFQTLAKDKTVIIVAHRLKTIQRADLILLVEQGEIVERGTHMELIKQGGRYKNLMDLTDKADQLSIKKGV